MSREVIMTPEQLYYMGKIMCAKYIDYAYIAAVKATGVKKEFFEKEVNDELISLGIISEDFVGNIEIDSSVKKIMEPVFFGEIESVVEMSERGEKSICNFEYRIHIYGEAITLAYFDDNKIKLIKVSKEDILSLIQNMLPTEYAVSSAKILSVIDKSKMERVIVVKSTSVHNKTVVELFVQSEGVLYGESSEGGIMAMEKDVFCKRVYECVKGERL